MQYYAVLAVATVIIGLLTLVLWRKTGSIAFPIGIALLYYWTLLGAWFIVQDLLGGNTGLRYQYYFYKLFPVRLDDDYFWTLVLYSSFIVVIQLAVLHWVRTPNESGLEIVPIRISHAKILILTSIAGLIAYLLVRNSLASAEAGNRSGYAFVRYDPSVRLFTVHQILNRVALLSLCVGAAILTAGKRARYIIGASVHWTTVAGYIVVLGLLFHFNLLLGNRYEIANSAIAAVLFYLSNDRRPNKVLLATVCFIAMAAVGYVGFTRGYGGEDVLLKGDFGTVLSSSLNENVVSNEPFEAHLSLYGVIHKNVPVTYGSSFVSLAASVVPRILWPTRPDNIYIYYIREVGAPDTQGYNIHHATGWYLNFGVSGVIAGALLFGWFWAVLFNQFHSDLRNKSHVARVFSILSFCTCTSAIPAIVRAGIEGYKTIALEALIFPTALFTLASLRIVLRQNKPALAIHAPTRAPTPRILSSSVGSGTNCSLGR